LNRFVLDACCLIAFFNQEKGFEVVERILSEENEVYISIVNVFEICYDLERSNPEVNGTEIYEDILDLPIQIEDKIDKIHLQHFNLFQEQI
jgi:PIN domain nuclease of toxin-antitoxin system